MKFASVVDLPRGELRQHAKRFEEADRIVSAAAMFPTVLLIMRGFVEADRTRSPSWPINTSACRATERRSRQTGRLAGFPDHPIIPFIEGDGIGVDITPVMKDVVDAAVQKGLRR